MPVAAEFAGGFVQRFQCGRPVGVAGVPAGEEGDVVGAELGGLVDAAPDLGHGVAAGFRIQAVEVKLLHQQRRLPRVADFDARRVHVASTAAVPWAGFLIQPISIPVKNGSSAILATVAAIRAFALQTCRIGHEVHDAHRAEVAPMLVHTIPPWDLKTVYASYACAAAATPAPEVNP